MNCKHCGAAIIPTSNPFGPAWTHYRASQVCATAEPETDEASPGVSDAWVDNQGDVWRLGGDGLMHSYETAPFAREFVEKKWGPLRPARTLGGTADEALRM